MTEAGSAAEAEAEAKNMTGHMAKDMAGDIAEAENMAGDIAEAEDCHEPATVEEREHVHVGHHGQRQRRQGVQIFVLYGRKRKFNIFECISCQHVSPCARAYLVHVEEVRQCRRESGHTPLPAVISIRVEFRIYHGLDFPPSLMLALLHTIDNLVAV